MIAWASLVAAPPSAGLAGSDAELRNVERHLARLAARAGGTVGVAAVHLETGRGVSVNGAVRFPMASTMKVAVAVQLLTVVERGELGLDSMVALEPHHVHPGSGIISRRFRVPGLALSIRNLLELALVASDNSASDILLDLAGGADAVTERLRKLGFADISIARPTIQLLADVEGVTELPSAVPLTPSRWSRLTAAVPSERRQAAERAFFTDPRDTTTPEAMARCVAAIGRGEALSPQPTTLLLDAMARCETGNDRLRGLLPPNTRVAHKSGSIDGAGRRRAPRLTADVGIVELPRGAGHVAIAAFVKGSTLAAKTQNRVIARMARAVYDCFAKSARRANDGTEGTMKRFLKDVVTSYAFFWARLVMRRRRPFIVGVTGSVGKTTTKEVVAAALMHPEVRPMVEPVWKTPGNMNCNKGFPLAVLGYQGWPRSRWQYLAWLAALPLRSLAFATFVRYPKTLVLEYGAGPDSDVGRTAALAPPTIAVVTAVGPAHLELFGTVARVAHEKGALVRQVPPSGLVILGKDNVIASGMDRYARAKVLKVAGRGRVLSENVARAVCDFVGVPPVVAERAVNDRPVVNGRLDVIDLGYVTVIDDSYNANPMSMQLGLDTLVEQTPAGGRRVAILGQMGELGKEAPSFHREVGEYARMRADVIIGVGALAKHYEPNQWFATSDECADKLTTFIREGDSVFVKGSHSVHLDRVVRRLKRIAREANGARAIPA